jgi:oligopeptide/dipeptide ABC transporter ATP-binding protein
MPNNQFENNVLAKVKDLKVHFNSKRGVVHAVDGVDFEILNGETLGLVGETGCGKSVTGRSFLRLLPIPPGIIKGGAVNFKANLVCTRCSGKGCIECGKSGHKTEKGEQVDLLKISDTRMREIRGDRIAMIFQDPGKALNPTLTVGAQMAEVFLQHRSLEILDMAGLGQLKNKAIFRFANQDLKVFDKILLLLPKARKQKLKVQEAVKIMVSKALSETQVPNPLKLLDRFPHELSGGMRQRVMIAQALACNPDLLIADEPTTALDVTVEARILELIRELQLKRKTSVLYISHDLSLVRRICDRVAVMYAGRIVEIGKAEEIFANPSHPYTRGLMAAVPSNGIPRGSLSAIKGTVPELIDPPDSCRFSGRCPYEVNGCRVNDPKLRKITESHSVACFINDASLSWCAPSFEEERV